MSMMEEKGSIILLLILYTLQGIPMGLSAAIPFLLQNKISYAQQAVFSVVSLPFSLKLLWAPIVDSLYVKSFGRRKSWLVPVQVITGLLMIWGGNNKRINEWVGEGESKACVHTLTIYFTILYILMATQDIAVDGWALTMLSKKNKGYASTCNSVGQTLGYFISHVGFLILNDANSCNIFFRIIPRNEGIVSLAGFIYFWGCIIICITIALWIFKKEVEIEIQHTNIMSNNIADYSVECFSGEENPVNFDVVKCLNTENKMNNVLQEKDTDKKEKNDIDLNCPEGVIHSYKQLWKLLWLGPIQLMSIILLTCRIPFAATDASTHFKIIENGMSKEQLAFFAPLLIPIGIISPIMVGKLTAGPRPLKVFFFGMLCRMVLCVIWTGVLPLTAYAYKDTNSPHFIYFIIIFFITAFYNLSTDLMFVSQMAFFAKISDPTIGGTYMTFLNTVTNLGNKWPHIISLWMLDYLTIKSCDDKGVCNIIFDGYYIEVIFCLFVGIIWILFFKKYLTKIECINESDWHLVELENI